MIRKRRDMEPLEWEEIASELRLGATASEQDGYLERAARLFDYARRLETV